MGLQSLNTKQAFQHTNVAYSLAQWAYFQDRFGTPNFYIASKFVEGGVG